MNVSNLLNLLSLRFWIFAGFTSWLFSCVFLALLGFPPSVTTPIFIIGFVAIMALSVFVPARCPCGARIKPFAPACRNGHDVRQTTAR